MEKFVFILYATPDPKQTIAEPHSSANLGKHRYKMRKHRMLDGADEA